MTPHLSWARLGLLSIALTLSACAEGLLVGADADLEESPNTSGSFDTTLDASAADLPTPDIPLDAAPDSTTDVLEPDTSDTDPPDAGDDSDPREDPDLGEGLDALDVADAEEDVPLECGDLAQCGNECVDLLTEPGSCGFCGRTCVINNAESACVEGDCRIGACEPGYFDVDGMLSNGCEVFDLCQPGELCFTECGGESVTTCEDGVASCLVPPESCNLLDDDCNGGCDEGAIAGCRTGVHRAHGNGHVFTDDLGFAGTAPYRVESANYFHLYSAAGPSLRPLFLCRKPSGKYLLSTQTACEIGVAPTRTVGYISAENQCGSVPLYRLYHSPSDNHFYTLSAAERDNARDALDYTEQGIAGYVWGAP